MPAHGPHHCRCSGQGLNHPSLIERNMVNPTSRLDEADDSARSDVGIRGSSDLPGFDGHDGCLQMVSDGREFDGSSLPRFGANDGEAKAIKGFAVMGWK
jgi:hypothetical protein